MNWGRIGLVMMVLGICGLLYFAFTLPDQPEDYVAELTQIMQDVEKRHREAPAPQTPWQKMRYLQEETAINVLRGTIAILPEMDKEEQKWAELWARKVSNGAFEIIIEKNRGE